MRAQALRRRRQWLAVGLSIALTGIGAFAFSLSRSSNVSAASPPASYFSLLPSGSVLPTETSCAAQVHRSPWEPRIGNTTANRTIPPVSYHVGRDDADWNATWHTKYWPRVTGNFIGTTDEIFQWGACKWGLSDDFIRAEAVQESNWRQDAEGDINGSGSNCITGDTRSPCPTSFGIMQVKWYYHPPIKPSTHPESSWPYIKTSTAFNVDMLGAHMRGCLDGLSTYFGNSSNDLWGCSQSWFSGGYTQGGGSYSAQVRNIMTNRPWLGWADQGGGTTPPTTVSTTTTISPVTTTLPVTTTTQSPTTTTQNTTTTVQSNFTVYACINDYGVIESRRQGVFPQTCGNSSDRRITWSAELHRP